jgi:methionyl-tRNA formyltransferase
MNLSIKSIERIVLLGGGNLLLSLVNRCKSEGTPISVVTSPRHAQEHVGNRFTLTEELDRLSVPYLVTSDIDSKESKEFLDDVSDAFCLSLGAAWIFKKEIITELFKDKLFNLHGTRLPQNRGGGGFSWQIMMGNRLGFCQLHLVDSGVDTGDLVRTKEFLYPAYCRTPLDYEKVYLEKNIDFVTDLIEEIRQRGIEISTTKQSEYFSSYWPRLNTSENGWIEWSDNIDSLERFICSFDQPYEGCKTFINGQKVFIKSVMSDFGDQFFHKFQSGIIYRKSSSWLMVAAVGGSLIVQEVLDESGKNIIQDIRVGDRFVTPSTYLEARGGRVTYTPLGKK